MIRVAICDDDITITSIVEQMIQEIQAKQKLVVTIDVFYDGSNLLNRILAGDRYDLVYLDIQMKQVNGIDTAQFIRKCDTTVLFVFMSAYESYLKQLFEVEPFRFISKPIDPVLFEQYFEQAYDRIMNNSELFQFCSKREVCKLPLKSIKYFASEGRSINIITDKKPYQFYGKLSKVEEELKDKKTMFLRIHQSYLVNFNYVTKVRYLEVELADGQILSISRERQKKLQLLLCKMTGE